jgi:hypothetical protein
VLQLLIKIKYSKFIIQTTCIFKINCSVTVRLLHSKSHKVTTRREEGESMKEKIDRSLENNTGGFRYTDGGAQLLLSGSYFFLVSR